MPQINDNTAIWDEQIEKFLTKQMTPDEERRFLEQVSADREMKEYVAAATLLISKVRQQGRDDDAAFQRAARKATKREIYAATGRRQPVSMVVRLSPIIAVAACACMFFGNSYLLKTDAIEFAESAGITALDMPRGDNVPDISALVAKVDEGTDLANTIAELNGIFSSLPEKDSAEYRTVGWYLALAYIKQGDNEAARDVLQQVIKVCPDFAPAWQLRDRLSRTFFWQ